MRYVSVVFVALVAAALATVAQAATHHVVLRATSSVSVCEADPEQNFRTCTRLVPDGAQGTEHDADGLGKPPGRPRVHARDLLGRLTRAATRLLGARLLVALNLMQVCMQDRLRAGRFLSARRLPSLSSQR